MRELADSSWTFGGTQNRVFNLESTVPLPVGLNRITVDDEYIIFFEETQPSWVVCTEAEAMIVELFSNQYRVGDAIRFLIKHDELTEAASRAIVTATLEKLSDLEFLGLRNSRLAEKPKTLHIYLTERCYLKCIHCYMDSAPKMSSGLPYSELESIIIEYSQLYPSGKVVFSGGEPLIRFDDLIALAKKAQDLGLSTHLITNGTLISEEKATLLSSCLDSIKISLDGPTRATHERIRGEGTFDNSVAALLHLDKYDIDKTLAMTVFPDTLSEFEQQLIPFLEKINLNHIYVSLNLDLIKTGRAVDEKVFFVRTDDQEKRLFALIDKVWEKGWVRDAHTPMFRKMDNCGIGDVIAIRSDGSVMPCVPPYMSFGTFHRGLKAIDEQFTNLKEETSVENIIGCDTCFLRRVCLGGCKMENMVERGGYHKTGCSPEIRVEKLRRLIYRPSLPLRS